MATQAERIATLETHHEHVDKTLTAISGTLDAVRADVAQLRVTMHGEITEVRTHLDARFDRVQKAIADDRVQRSETMHGEITEVRTLLDARFDRVQKAIADDRVQRSETMHGEITEVRKLLDDRFDRVQKAIADDRVQRSETKLRVALRVIGWLAGVVTTVLGAVVGGLFVFARFLLPKLGKLASLAHDTAPLVG